jgi:hypothetical protein
MYIIILNKSIHILKKIQPLFSHKNRKARRIGAGFLLSGNRFTYVHLQMMWREAGGISKKFIPIYL